MSGRWVRGWRVAGAVLVGTLLLGSASSADVGQPRYGGPVDLVASAQPSGASRTVEDHAYDARWTWQDGVDVHTVATSSAICDACRGVARTVQVLFVGWSRSVHADNVATAWSSCTGCGSRAVSVQVVLTRGVFDVRANNRALGVNASCVRCDASAAAYQLVLSTRSHPDLRALRDRLVTWVRTFAPAPAATALRSAAPRTTALDALQALVTRAAPGRVLQRSADVR